MILDARTPEKPAGILVDGGTGQRIPFGFWFNAETGDFEAYEASPDGSAIVYDERGQPVLVKGKAKGQLKLVPVKGSAKLPESKAIDNAAGLEQYKRLYFNVWQWRGESKRGVGDRWTEFLMKSDFLDDFVVRRGGPKNG